MIHVFGDKFSAQLLFWETSLYDALISHKTMVKLWLPVLIMNITPNLPFLNIQYPFTNERISVYLDKHSPMSLDTKDYVVKQISHLSKGAVVVASVKCQLFF